MTVTNQPLVDVTMSLTIVLLSSLCLSLACQDFQHGVGSDIALIRDELQRQGELTDVLMQLVHDQNARIVKHEERIQLLSEHTTEQGVIIERQAKRIADLEHIHTLLDGVLSPRHELNNNAETLPPGEDNDTANKASTAGMIRVLLKERARFVEGPVAFQAGLRVPDLTHISIGQKIAFDDVNLNIGGGYNGQLGIFTAPKAGVYIFSVTILANAYTDLEVFIKKNGGIIGGAYGNTLDEGGFDQGSVTVALQLSVGDEVYVENNYPENASLRGVGHSNFMGCLIVETP